MDHLTKNSFPDTTIILSESCRLRTYPNNEPSWLRAG